MVSLPTFKMRVLILIDEKNFEQGIFNLCRRRDEFRYIDFYKLNNFIMNYLKHNLQYKDCNLRHVRTYLYTGEFTDKLIQKIERSVQKNPEEKEVLGILVERFKDKQKKQEEFFKKAKNYYFFEIKSKPLQFSPSDLKIFQKGVDVQLAVDLVDYCHKDVFDIAILLSGDIDLLESVKTIKNMGKQIIIFGDSYVTAEEMKKVADMFVDTGRFIETQLNEFSHKISKRG